MSKKRIFITHAKKLGITRPDVRYSQLHKAWIIGIDEVDFGLYRSAEEIQEKLPGVIQNFVDTQAEKYPHIIDRLSSRYQRSKITSIQDVITELSSKTFDQLTDLLDYIAYAEATNELAKHDALARRRGKDSMQTLSYRMQRDQAYQLYRKLSHADKATAKQTATVLQQALAPQLRRRNANGVIQLKYKINWLFDPISGAPIIDEETGYHKRKDFGPYLYLRLWATGGNRDKQSKRFKSFYIGGDASSKGEKLQGGYPYNYLAEHYANLYDTTSKVKKNKYNLPYSSVTRKRTDKGKALGSRILACIDLETDPPTIDHNALLALQASLLHERQDDQ